jgi:hypothetical protein
MGNVATLPLEVLSSGSPLKTRFRPFWFAATDGGDVKKFQYDPDYQT